MSSRKVTPLPFRTPWYQRRLARGLSLTIVIARRTFFKSDSDARQIACSIQDLTQVGAMSLRELAPQQLFPSEPEDVARNRFVEADESGQKTRNHEDEDGATKPLSGERRGNRQPEIAGVF